MNLNRFLKEVHRNAVDHGFWEGERDITESAALIHSEWSEALEEYRADRPMIWYECKEIEHATPKPCDPKDLGDCLNYEVQNTCPHRGKKPEGMRWSCSTAASASSICLESMDAPVAALLPWN